MEVCFDSSRNLIFSCMVCGVSMEVLIIEKSIAIIMATAVEKRVGMVP